MDINEFKRIHYSDAPIHCDRREIFNCRNSVYEVNEIPVAILFVGDSITERFEIYPYFSRFGNVVNRGIGGEKTSELRERIEIDVINLKPKVCVIAEGVNNLAEAWRIEHEGESVSEKMKAQVLSDYEKDITEILQKLKANMIIPVVGAVLPIGVSDCRNELILRENQILKRLCERENAYYVDYYSAFVREDGITMQDLTFGDDLHPHVMGYNKIAALLIPIFEKIFNQ